MNPEFASLDQTPPRSLAPPLLCLAMIVRDGGQFLAPLLAGARPWVDEMVVGDTGSRDRSVAVATAAGAIVHHLAWQDDFAAARNEVLSRCRSEWILVLDADEEIGTADWRALRAWVQAQHDAGHPQAGRLHTRNYQADRYGKRGWTPVPSPDPHAAAAGPPSEGFVTTSKVRLFPNRPRIRFRGRIHETVEASLGDAHVAIVDLPWPVHHYGYLAPAADKNKRYLHLAHLKTTEEPHNARAWSELADCAVALGDHQRALVAIERSLALDPRHPDRRLTAGWLLWQTGDPVRAEAELAAVCAADQPEAHLLAEAAHLRAQIAMRDDRPRDAVPLLAVCVRLFPDNGHFQNTLGSLNLMLGRGEAAQRALLRSVELLPGQVEPCLNLALLYEASGAREPAAAQYQEALRRDPGNLPAAAGAQRNTLVPSLG
jgi:tetratricopeptide (TPR) repeat protein